MVSATKQKIDPRCIPGALVKVPSGSRAYVTGVKGDRVTIDYEIKSIPSDSYPVRMLTLVQASLEPVEATPESITTEFRLGDRVIIPTETDGRTYSIEEMGDDDYLLTFRDAKGVQRRRWMPIGMLESSPSLIATAQTLWAEIDQAIAVADQAQYSALDSARLCGETLLQLKAETPHGQWEAVRGQIVHPRTGRAMPSQTATLYQRISEKWEALKAEGVQGIKQADEALRRLKPAKEQPETKSPTVGEINPDAIKQAVEEQKPPFTPIPAQENQKQPESYAKSCTNSTSLPYNLKSLAQQKSDEIYNALCKLDTKVHPSDLPVIAAEVKSAIAKILEFHFLQ